MSKDKYKKMVITKEQILKKMRNLDHMKHRMESTGTGYHDSKKYSRKEKHKTNYREE